jgi:hypothetical protein
MLGKLLDVSAQKAFDAKTLILLQPLIQLTTCGKSSGISFSGRKPML